VTSKNNGHTPEFRMATRDTPNATDTQHAIADSDLMLLSAFVDGALEPADEALLLARLDVEPALVDALSDLAALRGALTAREEAIDVADAVMAVVAPEGLSDTVNGALLGGMLLADGEAASSRVPHVGAADAALYGFMRTTEVVRVALHTLPALPHSLAPAVESVLVDDDRALEFAMHLADGEAAGGATDALAALLDDGAHGARRIDEIVHFMESAARVGHEVRRAISDPAALHAGERAVAAIVATENAAHPSTGGGRVPSREPQAPLFARVMRLFPVGVALAALAVFVVIARIDGGDGPAPNLSPPSEALAMAPFDLLPDNTSTVEALETGSGSAVVFSTSASHITIIWVGGGNTSEQGT